MTLEEIQKLHLIPEKKVTYKEKKKINATKSAMIKQVCLAQKDIFSCRDILNNLKKLKNKKADSITLLYISCILRSMRYAGLIKVMGKERNGYKFNHLYKKIGE